MSVRAFILLLVSLPGAVIAQDSTRASASAATPAPHLWFETKVAEALAPGQLAVELGGQNQQSRTLMGNRADAWIRVGVLSHLEFAARLQNVRDRGYYVVSPVPCGPPVDLCLSARTEIRRESGMLDPRMALKWQFVDKGELLDEVSVVLSKTVRMGRVSAAIADLPESGVELVGSRRLGPLSLDVSAGVSRLDGNGYPGVSSMTTWSAALGGGFPSSVQWRAELAGRTSDLNDGGRIIGGPYVQNRVIARGGVSWEIARLVALNAGIESYAAGSGPRSFFLSVTTHPIRLW
jgi:hypothetical protein